MRKGFIAIFGQHLKTTSRCVVVNVYATCTLRDKEDSLEGAF